MSLYLALVLAFLGMTALRATRILLALFALHVGADTFEIGVLGALFSIVPLALSLQVGRWSDRFGSRWPLTVGAAASVFGMLLPAFLPLFAVILAAATISGLSATCYIVSLQNLVGQLSTPANRARYFSNLSLALALASFVGPVLTGVLIDRAGYAQACLAVAALAALLLAMLFVCGGRLPGGKRSCEPQTSGAPTRGHAGLAPVLIASALVQCGLDMFQFYLPVYGRELGLSASQIGMIVAMYSAAALAVRAVLPAVVGRFQANRVLVCAFVLGAASFALMPSVDDALALGVLAFTFGIGMGVGQPVTMMLAFSSAREGRSGEGLGLRLTVNNVTQVVAPLAFGVIGAALGLHAIFLINALLLAAGGAISRRVRGPSQGQP